MKKKKADTSVATAAEQANLLSVEGSSIDVPLVEAPTSIEKAVVALVAPAPTQDAPVEILPTIEEQDDDMVFVEAPTIPAKLTISRVPSMLEVGSEDKRPAATLFSSSPDWVSTPIERPLSQQQGKAPATSTGSGAPMESRTPSNSLGFVNIQIPATHDVSALDKGFRVYIDTCKKWLDRMAVVIAERDTIRECLQAISDKEKEMEEWEKKLEEENSHLKTLLESARANLESVNNDLDSVHSELGAVQSELASI
ncbi:hypothetical protein COCNU_08G000710 [Cocos nucifera]|uniref:Uncharacterized protein n=1 Tax=Cocos nucifera TaxID=13894 RepID=A0A8K0IH59_COCNU|nr:hypothetical protein COCNU_08G000710 [Cocos nucifera]